MMTNHSKPAQPTQWDECFAPDATTDRGWLKALCSPWDRSRVLEYTSETMPVSDDSVAGGWREQSTLGNYLDYAHTHRSAESQEEQPGFVHAVCYPAHTSRWCESIAQAKDWIEAESLRVRPNLTFQGQLSL